MELLKDFNEKLLANVVLQMLQQSVYKSGKKLSIQQRQYFIINKGYMWIFDRGLQVV